MKPTYLSILLILAISIGLFSCTTSTEPSARNEVPKTFKDESFVQEWHDGYKVGDKKEDNEIRSIAVDPNSTVWVATASGVFKKNKESREWEPVITGKERGPSYEVEVLANGDVLLGTWDGLYRVSNGKPAKESGVVAPISEICSSIGGTFALGPNGIWNYQGGKWTPQDYSIARSVRDALVDDTGGLYVATDAGLYYCKDGKSTLYQETSELISCYVKGISFSQDNKLWTGVMGGVSIRKDNKQIEQLTPKEGIPSTFVNCVSTSPEGVMWVGTNVGVVRYQKDGSHTLRFSKRWLTHDKVNDVAFDPAGNAWVATANGVSAIKRKTMTLADKQADYYHKCMTMHIREPWICGNLRLTTPGDTSTWRNSDDDNDGEYTGGYLCMETFRYLVTKDEDAKIKARKAFDFLRQLQYITETEGFFARTFVPSDWTEVHDVNRTYTERQLAEELVKDPRYKPVENRWRLSSDGKWLWKGDTSSDEMCGHMMAYFFFYEFAANEEEKQMVRDHVKKIIDVLIKHNYNLVDIDGQKTRWGVWSPDDLNGDPDWSSEKAINSFELLAYLKLAATILEDPGYQNEYDRLIKEEGYLDNMARINSKNPAWQIYFDRTLEGYIFPIFLKYEKDPKLKKFYEDLCDEWMAKQTTGENLINNLIYGIFRGKIVNTQQTIDFLRDTPLDLVDWTIDHTKREDVTIVRSPILEELQIAELPHASMRATVRWDKNPWAAIHGNPGQVREPVFWLWPYWMARYLNIIEE